MKGFLKGMCIAALSLFVIGIALIICGFTFGGRATNLNFSNLTKQFFRTTSDNFDTSSYDNFDFDEIAQPTKSTAYNGKIKSIDFEFGASDVILQVGDTFDFKHDGRYNYRSELKNDGTWKIDMDVTQKYTNELSTVYITIPKDTVFEEVEISSGAGKLTIEQLKAEKVSFFVGAGELEVEDFLCTGDAEIEIGAANATINGDFKGRTSITCGAGNIEINLIDIKDVGYKLELGLGQVNVLGRSYSGIADSQYNVSAASFFNIECGLGKVEIQ